MTNQDDFDLIWPDPLSLTHYNWIYPAEEAGGVIRYDKRGLLSLDPPSSVSCVAHLTIPSASLHPLGSYPFCVA